MSSIIILKGRGGGCWFSDVTGKSSKFKSLPFPRVLNARGRGTYDVYFTYIRFSTGTINVLTAFNSLARDARCPTSQTRTPENGTLITFGSDFGLRRGTVCFSPDKNLENLGFNLSGIPEDHPGLPDKISLSGTNPR